MINAGQQAAGLIITDVIPVNTSYVPGSATADGQLIGGQIRWELPVLGSATGSTGDFRNARGEMSLHSRNAAGTEFDFIFRLTP